jgi:hypothetical protein
VWCHLQQYGLHAVGEHGARQTTKVFAAEQQTADQGGDITAFGEGDEPHARIAQHRREAKHLMIAAGLVVAKFAPIKLQLLARRRFVAANRKVPGLGWAQWCHKGFELADTTGVAKGAQAVAHRDAIEQMILLHPTPDLLLERIELHGFGGACRWHRRAAHIFAHGITRQAKLPGNRV